MFHLVVEMPARSLQLFGSGSSLPYFGGDEMMVSELPPLSAMNGACVLVQLIAVQLTRFFSKHFHSRCVVMNLRWFGLMVGIDLRLVAIADTQKRLEEQ